MQSTITQYPDFFVVPFEISLHRPDFTSTKTWKIAHDTMLIIIGDKNITRDDLNLEDYSDMFLASLVLVLPQVHNKVNRQMAVIELRETNQIAGSVLFNPETKEKFWISHYDLEFLLHAIKLLDKQKHDAVDQDEKVPF